ncbi:MAG TPA: hypothetical protein VH251_12660, partial [Verrucomicrobiae bacterium]|nr:hypothetical protein [Verrucomicrobiae bacterium]
MSEAGTQRRAGNGAPLFFGGMPASWPRVFENADPSSRVGDRRSKLAGSITSGAHDFKTCFNRSRTLTIIVCHPLNQFSIRPRRRQLFIAARKYPVAPNFFEPFFVFLGIIQMT